MHNLSQTLAEQLNISKHEIERRKSFLNFTEKDEEILLAYKPVIAKHCDGIVKNFYDFLTRYPEVSAIIGDAESMRRLSSAMNRYVLELFDGHYDIDYVSKRLRIGLVHQRIGVSTDLYLAAVYQLQLNIHNTVAMYEMGNSDFMDMFALRQAINKIIMFDIQFVLETYYSGLVNQVEAARKEVKKYANSLEKKVEDRTKELEELSMRDMLTGLYNQRAFFDYLRREISNAERYRESMVLCYLDLNGFKAINDKKGHQEGDEVLITTGNVIKKSMRDGDLPCRYGGDEFALILPRTTLEEADTFAKRLIKNFKIPEMCGVSFSMGMAGIGPDVFIDHEKILTAADNEMYKAKAKTKQRRGFYISSTHVNA
ncbi:MAG: GGDEF domain-containing protein [Gammaproteobacteria bacterium]|nr:GGDEF domain-containing protein [Gammaproteobacteria bacterium]MCW8988394.1 GGDEF domain-containing protein [Gammaproteobacteria bacterium]MCW9031971.1 GGDEF domain-containing protein [Gammaproteobacteria bacterium]